MRAFFWNTDFFATDYVDYVYFFRTRIFLPQITFITFIFIWDTDFFATDYVDYVDFYFCHRLRLLRLFFLKYGFFLNGLRLFSK
jgi:hypothetical protein